VAVEVGSRAPHRGQNRRLLSVSNPHVEHAGTTSVYVAVYVRFDVEPGVPNGDPLPWLPNRKTLASGHLALLWLLDESEDSPTVLRSCAAAMRTDPIATRGCGPD
jgi:hypothetical protein